MKKTKTKDQEQHLLAKSCFGNRPDEKDYDNGCSRHAGYGKC